MLQRIFAILILTVFALSLQAAPNTPRTVPAQSAAQIVDKNVAARGGLAAWRAVQTMTLTGKLGAGGNQRATLAPPNRQPGNAILPKRPAAEAQLPFVMDLKRPRKQRLELQFNGKTAIQTYDGLIGWKLRPFLNRLDVEPFTPDEMKIASAQGELDGFLIDYAAKNTKVELDGSEKVEGRDTYRLKLTLKSGELIHVWVDAQTFLEAKVEGQPRRLDGTDHPVEVYYRDYRPVSGLQIPFLLETRVLPVGKTAGGLGETPVPPERIVIENVVVNAKLDDALFSKPQITASASNSK
jgi:hypothetical protein